MNKTLLTKDGYDQLVKELALLKERSEHLINEIEAVAQPDESGEDGLASQLKEELEVVNEKMTNIEEALANSQIISGNKLGNSRVQVGSKVKIKVAGNTTKLFHIVSHIEADPNQDKISDQSPLGLALLGKKLNDLVEVIAPVGKISYKIVAIS
jgi:transcription elongation factor GreA